MMARVAARRRRYNLIALVTLGKGNRLGEAIVRRGQKKLCTTEEDSLKGPHEEAKIQRKAWRRGKNLAFSEDTCLKKKIVRLNVTPRKVEIGNEVEGGVQSRGGTGD